MTPQIASGSTVEVDPTMVMKSRKAYVWNTGSVIIGEGEIGHAYGTLLNHGASKRNLVPLGSDLAGGGWGSVPVLQPSPR